MINDIIAIVLLLYSLYFVIRLIISSFGKNGNCGPNCGCGIKRKDET